MVIKVFTFIDQQGGKFQPLVIVRNGSYLMKTTIAANFFRIIEISIRKCVPGPSMDVHLKVQSAY